MTHWLRHSIPQAGVLLLFLSSVRADDSVYLEYIGDMNKDTIIRLSLEHQGHTPRGIYFYKKWLKDIRLSGEYLNDRDIVLREYDDQGKVAGSFFLKFAEKDPRKNFGDTALNKEVLVGTWISADSSKRYPVYLHLTSETRIREGQNRYSVAGAADAALVERNAQAFYNAVLKGERQEAAKYISSPLSFNDQGKRRQVSNQAAFLRYYNQIFTKAFVARIAEGIPHNMFAKVDGIMLGNGDVWFDQEGKAFQLNN